MYRAIQNNESAMRESMLIVASQNPGILAAAALRRVHHHRSRLQRDARQPARHDDRLFAVEQAIGPQIDVAACDRVAAHVERGNARQADDVLRNIIPRIGFQLAPEVLDLIRRGCGSHQHAVPSRLAHRLHHHLRQVLQHVAQMVRARAQVRLHVAQNRVLAQVVADELGDISVNSLVVRHAVPHRIRQRHIPRAIRIHQSRHAQHRILPEDQRIQEVVVNAAVDHIHAR
jgi:hypothetical protein